MSGNVSFYNESFGNAIYPTPMVGMLGVFDDVTMHCDARFKNEGDLVVLLGPADGGRLDGSEYQKVHYGRVEGRVPDVDLALEVELQRVLREGIAARPAQERPRLRRGRPRRGPRRVLHRQRRRGRRADGGSAAVARRRPHPARGRAAPRPRAVRRGPVARRRHLRRRRRRRARRASPAALPLTILGTVTGDRLQVALDGSPAIDLPVAELRRAYESLPERLA